MVRGQSCPATVSERTRQNGRAPSAGIADSPCFIGFLGFWRKAQSRLSYQDFMLLLCPATQKSRSTRAFPVKLEAPRYISHLNRRQGPRMRVAVIGTGIAGNVAAWALSERYPVTVYDRELRPGGHSHTVTIDYDGTPVAVDIGFIVYNEHDYPNLTALLAHLGVETVESSMSFAVSADAGLFEWKGCGGSWLETAQGLFAQRRNLLSPSYLWMLRDVLTFNTKSVEDYAAGRLSGLTLRDYFVRHGFAPRLLTDYLAPMGAAIWSAPADRMLDFPAENFVAFFSNHHLL
jgi:predicted NAD/FAD-binding protein